MESFVQIKWDQKKYEGKLTYEEGDLVEVDLAESVDIGVGKPVDCLLARNYEEIYNFNGVVLARNDTRLLLFIPPTESDYRLQRRRYPRFDTKAKGWVTSCEAFHSKDLFDQQSVEIINLSLGGLAFRCNKELNSKHQFKLYIDLSYNQSGGTLCADVEIIHTRKANDYLYGCKVTGITSRNLYMLRRYLLQRQLEMLLESK